MRVEISACHNSVQKYILLYVYYIALMNKKESRDEAFKEAVEHASKFFYGDAANEPDYKVAFLSSIGFIRGGTDRGLQGSMDAIIDDAIDVHDFVEDSVASLIAESWGSYEKEVFFNTNVNSMMEVILGAATEISLLNKETYVIYLDELYSKEV